MVSGAFVSLIGYKMEVFLTSGFREGFSLMPSAVYKADWD